MPYDKKFMESGRGKPCEICRNTEGTTYEHTITKGAGGPCIPQNCVVLCFIHHREKEQKGIDGMATRYPGYKKWLLKNGWYYFKGQWVNDKVNQHIREIERGWKW